MRTPYRIIIKSQAILLGLMSASTSISHANGIFSYTSGGREAGMGGAGLALATGADNGNKNPALMALLNNELIMTANAVHEDLSVDTSRTQLARALSGGFLPPHTTSLKSRLQNYLTGALFGVNYRLNPQWTIGASVMGGGGKTKLGSSIISPAASSPSKFNAGAVLISPTIGWKPSEKQAYGVSLILGYTFLSNDLVTSTGAVTRDANMTATAPGIGARVGGVWNLNKKLSLGASVSSPVFFKKLDKYRDVIRYSPDIPAMASIGAAWHVSSATQLVLDLGESFWSQANLYGKSPEQGGQGWKDVFIVKVGVQHALTEKLVVRTGYNYTSTPIRSNQLLANAFPSLNAVKEHTVTIGGTYKVSQPIELDFAAGYFFQKKFRDNGTGFRGPATQGMELRGSGMTVFAGLKWNY